MICLEFKDESETRTYNPTPEKVCFIRVRKGERIVTSILAERMQIYPGGGDGAVEDPDGQELAE